jgi:hypothetical protein
MGINTETKTTIEEDGVAKANVHAQLLDLDAQIHDMNRAGTLPCRHASRDVTRPWKTAGCSTLRRHSMGFADTSRKFKSAARRKN